MNSERQRVIGEIAVAVMAAVEDDRNEQEICADLTRLLGARSMTQALMIREAAAAVVMPQKSIIDSPYAHEVPEAALAARTHLLRLADDIEAQVRAEHDAFALFTRIGTESSRKRTLQSESISGEG